MDGSAPSTIGSIKSAATDGALTVGATAIIPGAPDYPLNQTVTFTGLTALQSYTLYCYVESSTGVGSSLSAVLSTKIIVSTICCKTLTYSNSPSILYGAVSKYVGSSASLYVFTYTLSAPPSVGVKVTPLLYLNGFLSTDILAIPSSANFISTSTLTGSFILSANALINGSFVIMLSVTGSSAVEYYNTTTTVQILASASLLPPPLMVSSKFSDSGQAVVITFNTPTDSAGIVTATWPCSTLFSFAGAPLSTCSWTTASTATVSGNVLLIPGSIVTLLGGLLGAYCTDSVVNCNLNHRARATSLSTLAPDNPTGPVVVLNCPLHIGSCANLVLDATASYGNGGRPYTTVQWSVSAVTDSSPAAHSDAINVADYLNAYSSLYQVSKPITILAQSLTKASYTITLSLTNFLSLKYFATIAVTLTIDPDIPLLSIIGPSYRTMVASSPLKILSVATFSSCSSMSDEKVTFAWTVRKESDNNQTLIKSTSLDPSIFSIPAYSLVANNNYMVKVTVSTDTSTISASIIVYVAHGVVTAVIVGGSYRSAPVDQELLIDASGSFDSDNIQGAASRLSYQVRLL